MALPITTAYRGCSWASSALCRSGSTQGPEDHADPLAQVSSVEDSRMYDVEPKLL